jgi:hypothetical protein
MFGKSKWFRLSSFGLGLRPATWQGWTYSGLWAAAIVSPAWMLAASGKLLEAAIWAGVLGFVLIRETRQMVHEIRREDLFVIDEDTDVTKIATEKYDLELRR